MQILKINDCFVFSFNDSSALFVLCNVMPALLCIIMISSIFLLPQSKTSFLSFADFLMYLRKIFLKSVFGVVYELELPVWGKKRKGDNDIVPS